MIHLLSTNDLNIFVLRWSWWVSNGQRHHYLTRQHSMVLSGVVGKFSYFRGYFLFNFDIWIYALSNSHNEIIFDILMDVDFFLMFQGTNLLISDYVVVSHHKSHYTQKTI